MASIRPLYYSSFNNPITATTDTSLTAALQYKIIDPTLYPKDQNIIEYGKFYPKTFNFLVAQVINLFGSLNFVYIAGTIFLFLILIIGIYFLAYELFGKKTIAFIAALLAASVKMGFGIEWGILFGDLMARSVVLALTPFLFLFFIRFTKNKKPKHLLILFFICGLLANIHPVMAFHLTIVMLLTFFVINIKDISRSIKFCFLNGVVFSIGALPIILKLFNNIGISNNSIIEIIKYRASSLLVTNYSLFEFVYIMGFMFFPLVVGLSGLYLNKKREKKLEFNKTFFYMFIITASLFLFCLLAEPISLIRTLRFNRLSAFFYLYLSIYSAYAIYYLMRKKENRKKIFALVLLFMMLIPVGVVGKSLEPQIRLLFNIKEEKTPENIVKIDTTEDWDSFYDLDYWAKDNTNKDALFLVPPIGLSHFRVYSEKAIVVSIKDGGIATFSAELGEKWHNQYKEVLQLYTTNSTEEFSNITKKYNADFIIVDKEKNDLSLPLVYENKRYIVYKIS